MFSGVFGCQRRRGGLLLLLCDVLLAILFAQLLDGIIGHLINAGRSEQITLGDGAGLLPLIVLVEIGAATLGVVDRAFVGFAPPDRGFNAAVSNSLDGTLLVRLRGLVLHFVSPFQF